MAKLATILQQCYGATLAPFPGPNCAVLTEQPVLINGEPAVEQRIVSWGSALPAQPSYEEIFSAENVAVADAHEAVVAQRETLWTTWATEGAQRRLDFLREFQLWKNGGPEPRYSGKAISKLQLIELDNLVLSMNGNVNIAILDLLARGAV